MGIQILMCGKKIWIGPFVVAQLEPHLSSCWRMLAVLALSVFVDMYRASYLVSPEIGHNSVVSCYWLVLLRQRLTLAGMQTPNAPSFAVQKFDYHYLSFQYWKDGTFSG